MSSLSIVPNPLLTSVQPNATNYYQWGNITEYISEGHSSYNALTVKAQKISATASTSSPPTPGSTPSTTPQGTPAPASLPPGPRRTPTTCKGKKEPLTSTSAAASHSAQSSSCPSAPISPSLTGLCFAPAGRLSTLRHLSVRLRTEFHHEFLAEPLRVRLRRRPAERHRQLQHRLQNGQPVLQHRQTSSTTIFGQLTQANDPRSCQFSGKFIFLHVSGIPPTPRDFRD